MFFLILNEDFQLEELETLTLSHCSFTEETLKSLLQHATKLKKIRFYDCLFEFKNQSIHSSLPLSSLEELSIENNKHPLIASGLEYFLAQAGHIKSLFLEKIRLVGTFSNELSLPHLTEIDIYSCQINLLQFKALLEATSVLETLTYRCCDNLERESFQKDLYLPELKELNLEHIKISANNFMHLINQSKKLKFIKLYHAKLKNDLDKNLPDLEHLTVDFYEMSMHNVTALLDCSNRLKCFDLNWGELEGLTKEVDVSGLEHLSLNPKNYDAQLDIEHILSKAKNLISLRINSSLSSPMNLPDFKKLEQLEMCCLSVTATNLMHLLSSPYLESLEIYYCDLLD